MNRSDDSPPIPLPRRPHGIESFRVDGTLEDESVHARWDGRWAVMSELLSERVELALAVEQALAEAGMTSAFSHASFRRAPEEFLLAVLTCCDVIHAAEFEIRGHHRVIAADTNGDDS